MMKQRPRWRIALRDALVRDGDPDRVLIEVIRQLDLPEDTPPASLPAIALARAIVAIGAELGPRYPTGHPVHRTIAGAEAFAASPSEATWDDYLRAATSSYPFGPGDGCHCILPPERHGERGGGCVSGSGTLRSIAYELGADRVVALTRAAILPWLDELAADDDA